MARIQRNIRLTGIVQGVELRDSAERIARERQLVGYAENLPDRSMRIVVEGEESDLDGYLDAVITEAFLARVTTREVNDRPADGGFTAFETKQGPVLEEMLLALKGGKEGFRYLIKGQHQLQSSSDRLESSVKEGSDRLGGKMDGLSRTTKAGFNRLGRKVDRTNKTLGRMESTLNRTEKKVNSTNKSLGTTNRTLGRMEGTLGRMEKKIDTTNTTLGRIGKKVDTTNRVAKGTNLALKGMSKKLGKRFDSVDKQFATLPASLNRTVRVAVEDALIAHDARRRDPGPSAGRPDHVAP